MKRTTRQTLVACLTSLLLVPLAALRASDTPQKSLPLSGEVFLVEGRTAFVIPPEAKPASRPIPWVWYAPTLSNLPGDAEKWMFERFTRAGIAIAGIDVGESYGSPGGRALYTAFYETLTTKRGFSPKPVMLGRSRGGLMTLSWAVENVDKVAGFAGIYPVCNVASYPGVAKASGAFGMAEEELATRLAEHNPIDRLAALAQAGVPLFAIHGDNDKVVPLEANSGEMRKRYEALSGKMQLIVPAGQGHNMWEGFFQCQELVDFVVAQVSRTSRAPGQPPKSEPTNAAEADAQKATAEKKLDEEYQALDCDADSERPVASLRVYNPTAWDGPVVLEIPTGRVASPGVLDWERIRLVRDGREIAFAIREGTPHWKAELVAPIKEPRAEDLLIFSTVLPPTTWVEIDVLPGQPIRRSALSVNRGRLTITYPDVKAVVDEATGTLLQLEASGQSILERPLAIAFHHGGGDKQCPVEPVRVSLVSSSSSAAMTELNFVLQVDDALAVGLTYRVHAGGLVEIWSDERPWKGRSPWLDRAATYSLALKGEKETLSYLVNRAPFYGFKDYEQVVKTPAVVHRGSAATVVELGEEFSNGRRWNRRLYLTSPRQAARAEVLAELADEGPILDIKPMKHLVTLRNSAKVVYPEKAAVAAEILAGALSAKKE